MKFGCDQQYLGVGISQRKGEPKGRDETKFPLSGLNMSSAHIFLIWRRELAPALFASITMETLNTVILSGIFLLSNQAALGAWGGCGELHVYLLCCCRKL